MALDRRLLNVLSLGLGFMLVFTAFQTMGNVEKTVLDSIRAEDKTFTGDGFVSLAVIYASFAVCNWMAPSVITILGPRLTMFIGACTYTLFIASFLFPKTWLLYLCSVVLGFGSASIWTGQGNYLTLNSDSTTISRNSGIFWAMLQCSMFFGNLVVTFLFQGKEHVDHETREQLFYILLGVSALGLVIMAVLRPALSADGTKTEQDDSGPLEALKKAVRLGLTRRMVFLSVAFLYTGLELSFFSGVYSPSLGFTKQLGSNAKQLVGISGIFIGIGEVLGGLLFGLLGKKTVLWGRDPIVTAGFVVHLLSFFLIFLNLPNDANYTDTVSEAYIKSNQYVAIFCSFLLGFGDACFNTQIFSILGDLYPENSAPAFAIFKFSQSISAAAAFAYSNAIGLHYQLGILTVTGALGTLFFCLVEWAERKHKNQSYDASSDSDGSNPTVPALSPD